MLDGQIADKAHQKGDAIESEQNAGINAHHPPEFFRLLFKFNLLYVLAGRNQFMLCNMQHLTDRGDQRDIRISHSTLPFGYGGIRQIQAGGKLMLCQTRFLPFLRDKAAKGALIL